MDLYISYQERCVNMDIIIATTNHLFWGLIHKDESIYTEITKQLGLFNPEILFRMSGCYTKNTFEVNPFLNYKNKSKSCSKSFLFFL